MDTNKIIIGVGSYFQTKGEFASWEDIQSFLSNDCQGHNLPKEEIVSILECFVIGGWLVKLEELYTIANKTIIKQEITRNVVDYAAMGLPSYAPEI